jgi:hypothetical protein
MRGFTAAALLGAFLSFQAAHAAEAVFPPASRIGIVPPQNMTPSKRFSGFENPDRAATISFVEMPSEAYGHLVSNFTKDGLKAQGLDMKSREEIKLGSRTGVLVAGAMTGRVTGRKWVLAVKGSDMTALLVAQVPGGGDGYSEAQMREALTSVALRAPVSVDEQVSALPFRIGDKAGFRPVRVISGNSVLFTDGPKDDITAVEQPIVILAASVTPPPPSGERREQFAQAALRSNQILTDIRVERSEGFRLKGQDWHEIVATAKEAVSGQPVVVMQTILFDADRYVRLVGVTRTETRSAALARFRTIADSIDTSL